MEYTLVVQQLIRSQGLPVDCWPQFHLFAEVKYHSASLGVKALCFKLHELGRKWAVKLIRE